MASSSSSALPGVKHKVIGLVSGGKDSCFNLMHCEANGHEVIAIANLKPETGVDELDSHLYQSVGTQMLPLMAQAMGKPLFSRIIKGKAVETGPEYGSRSRGGEGSGSQGDETEDLTELLREVIAAHPEATALASGAILSNYQRLRIEHVCSRLGLVSLAYLWQQPQTPLLDSMFASGLEAILVKVAGSGLGTDLVGRDLASVQPLLRRLEREYGSHPAGEGGEYETLTLSSPLFSHRITVLKSSVVVTDPEPYPVAYLRIDEAVLEAKDRWARPTVPELRQLLRLDEGKDLLDGPGQEVLDDMDVEKGSLKEDVPLVALHQLSIRDKEPDVDVQFARRGRWFAASANGCSAGDEDVGSELRQCFDSISSRLGHQKLSLPIHAAHITLLLSSMDLFAAANAAYTTYFGTSPPSRATVAVPLPARQRVRLEVVGFDDTPDPGSESRVGSRQALHVQSLSYWAPANIGPYSQSVIVNGRGHMAGQIPLIPASLTLPPQPSPPDSPYPLQSALALQHVRRILEVMRSPNSTGGGWQGWGESCTAWWASDKQDPSGLDVVRAAWTAWARQNDWEDVPVLFVQAKELPKGALVEYQVNFHTGRRDYTLPGVTFDEDDEELEPKYAQGQTSPARIWESATTVGEQDGGSRGVIFGRGADSLPDALRSGHNHVASFDHAVAIKVYHRADLSITSAAGSAASTVQSGAVLTYVPVFSIHDRQGRSWDFALDFFG